MAKGSFTFLKAAANVRRNADVARGRDDPLASNGGADRGARPIREAAFASLKAPLRLVRASVDPTGASEEREASGQ
jgi:hypothetical protein